MQYKGITLIMIVLWFTIFWLTPVLCFSLVGSVMGVGNIVNQMAVTHIHEEPPPYINKGILQALLILLITKMSTNFVRDGLYCYLVKQGLKKLNYSLTFQQKALEFYSPGMVACLL